MNLDSLTPQQRACVEHVDGPLLVSAGAGSGKTFMLTQRIAYALLNPGISGVSDIGEVLAITFTELAASEIKARVRNKLREEGLADQALKVDACWISTIHGMCSRILHENALELGLDPAFGLLDDTARADMLAACLNDELADGREGYRAFLAEYDSSASSLKARDMVFSLIDETSNVRGGLDAVRMAPVPDPREIAGEVLDAVTALESCGRTDISATGKQGGAAEKILNVTMGPGGTEAFERLAANAAGYGEVYRAVCALGEASFGFRKEPFATAAAAFKQSVLAAARECEMGLALPARDELVRLARAVWARYEAAKAEQGVLDQNDLLLRTLDAFENHPEVERLYRDRFHLVMVDEFQDTSALQIALVSHLTDGDRRLCTVGDTQQSIYRFRGADVATYLEHKRHMRGLGDRGGLACELDRNFRSHGDVIEFVNRVFGQEQAFGSREFIRLGYDEGHAARPGNEFPDVPRIDVLAVTGAYSRGASSDQRILVEAEGIARRFEALHGQGGPNCGWGDMVVLLGRMTKADVYARTLRAHGIPCTVAGGSGFAATEEARAVAALLDVLANPRDNAAMAACLTGPAFSMGADDLVQLGLNPQTAGSRGFWFGFFPDDEQRGPRAELARSLLVDAVYQAACKPVSAHLADIAVASGWLDRLQGQGPQGMAKAANLLKAIRLVEDIESDCRGTAGPAEVASRFRQKLAVGLKEKPGALNARAQDAVRIMTIHASKGLEFPIVALADFNRIARDTDKLALQTTGDGVLLSLAPDTSASGLVAKKPTALSESMLNRLEEAGLLETFDLADDLTAGQMHLALKRHALEEEVAELRRKFYVGATRPREALVVAANFTVTKAGDSTDRCIDDLRCALFGEGRFATVPDGVGFGGCAPARVERIDLALDGEGCLLVNGEPATGYLQPAMLDGDAAPSDGLVDVPEAPQPGERLRDLQVQLVPHNPARAGTFSFSALAKTDRDAEPDDRGGDEGDADREGGRGFFHADSPAFGSAVHQACQLMAEDLAARRAPGGTAGFALPEDDVLAACLRAWKVPAFELKALRAALTRWMGSDEARRAEEYPAAVPEAPFYVTLQGTQGEPVHMEGSIDLLCYDPAASPAGQTAFVVDYKTGGTPSETLEQLRAKHDLQARCYAYALLSQGFAAIELAFVRVEQESGAVRYRFEAAQLQELHEHIRARYALL